MALRALLDACVLVPAALRDTLLRAGEAYLSQPVWSDVILEETRRALVDALGVPSADAADLIATMRDAFPEAAVSGFDDIIPLMPVDPHDRHIAAAAIAGNAHVIVTLNTKHFPHSSLAPYHDHSCHVDVEEFEQAASRASSAADLEAAVGLCRGDLFPEFYEDCVLAERERLR